VEKLHQWLPEGLGFTQAGVYMDKELKEVLNEARKYGLRPGKWGLTLSRRKR